MIQPVERVSSQSISTPMPKLAMAHGTGISRYDTPDNRGMRSTESTASHTLSGTPEGRVNIDSGGAAQAHDPLPVVRASLGAP